jgi:hypothetical protein
MDKPAVLKPYHPAALSMLPSCHPVVLQPYNITSLPSYTMNNLVINQLINQPTTNMLTYSRSILPPYNSTIRQPCGPTALPSYRPAPCHLTILQLYHPIIVQPYHPTTLPSNNPAVLQPYRCTTLQSYNTTSSG